jgi:hypothetical protein
LRSQTTTVRTDSRGIEFRIDPDPRLAAAAGGAARYFADSAGLASETVVKFQKSVVAACQETFEHLTGDHAHLTVSVTLYPDRIEVVLAHEGEALPAVGLDQIAGFGNPSESSNALGGIDRVQYEAQAGRVVTRLTKYLDGATPTA